jgi:hypothetical protein
MVERDNNTIRAVSWSEVFPWLKIVRVFRLAIAPRALILGALGILLTVIGWWAVGNIFGTDSAATHWLKPFVERQVPAVPGPAGVGESRAVAERVWPWEALVKAVPNKPGEIDFGDLKTRPAEPVTDSWMLLSQPALQGIWNTGFGLADIVAIILCGLWAAAVWAFFGAAICRTAAVQLAADEQVGAFAAMRFAAGKWPAYFAAPLFPVGGVILAAIPVIILGLIMRAGGSGIIVAGILWPLALAAGFVMAILLLGLLFGWPLMWGTISTEGTDSFDALSRSYAYTFQRPLRYLFYAAVAAFIGALGWLLVQQFAAGVVWLSYWAAGFGLGEDGLKSIMGTGGAPLTGAAYVGAWLIWLFAGCVKLLAFGYFFSYFWSAAAAIYLLLRRDVDATEMDEVYLDEDATEPATGLPEIGADAAGAPVVEGGVSESAAPNPAAAATEKGEG